MPEDVEQCNCPPPGAPAWMATFGDMMSLLVTFFVLLLSFANTNVVKFKMAMGSMKEALGVEYKYVGEHRIRSTSPVELSDRQRAPTLDLTGLPSRMDAPSLEQHIMAELQRVIAGQGLEKIVEVGRGERGVVVRVKGHMLFEGGSDQLHPEAFIFLDEIAKLTRSFPYALSVEGHSDDLQSRSERFPTNWHLSAARAIAALRYLVEVGGIERERISAAGFAETRPLVPNDSARNRAANRRVEFVYFLDRRLPAEEKTDPWLPRALGAGGDAP
jgi:chemotaxis protein MotB